MRPGWFQKTAIKRGTFGSLSDDISGCLNAAAGVASGKILLFLHSNLEAKSVAFLECLAEHALRQEVGVVGAKLIHADRTIEEAGLIIGGGPKTLRKAFRGFQGDEEGYARRLQIIRNCSAVSGACLMTRKEVFEELGGFAECYHNSFYDVEFCLQAREKGYAVVWTPYAELTYQVGGQSAPPLRKDARTFGDRGQVVVDKIDPYYSVHLTDSKEDFSIHRV